MLRKLLSVIKQNPIILQFGQSWWYLFNKKNYPKAIEACKKYIEILRMILKATIIRLYFFKSKTLMKLKFAIKK